MRLSYTTRTLRCFAWLVRCSFVAWREKLTANQTDPENQTCAQPPDSQYKNIDPSFGYVMATVDKKWNSRQDAADLQVEIFMQGVATVFEWDIFVVPQQAEDEEICPHRVLEKVCIPATACIKSGQSTKAIRLYEKSQKTMAP